MGGEGFFPKPTEGAERGLFEEQSHGWILHPQNLLPVGPPPFGCVLGPSPPGVSPARCRGGSLRLCVANLCRKLMWEGVGAAAPRGIPACLGKHSCRLPHPAALRRCPAAPGLIWGDNGRADPGQHPLLWLHPTVQWSGLKNNSVETAVPHGRRGGDAAVASELPAPFSACSAVGAALMPMGWDGDRRGTVRWLVQAGGRERGAGGGGRSTPKGRNRSSALAL